MKEVKKGVTQNQSQRIWSLRCSEITFAVLKATLLQSGRILMDLEGNSYVALWKSTVAIPCLAKFTRNAAHSPEFVRKTCACIENIHQEYKMISNMQKVSSKKWERRKRERGLMSMF